MKPRILFLADIRNWAFHFNAQAITRILGDQFSFETLFTSEKPEIDTSRYDIIQIFYEMETYHLPFVKDDTKILKCVRSHYWELNGMSPLSCYHSYLSEAHAVCVTSRMLLSKLKDIPIPAFLCSSGVDTDMFRPTNIRSGPIVFGWAGNADRPIKQLELCKRACEGVGELRIAGGNLSHEEMVEFYNDIDVIVTTSKAEGDPRPVLEGMSCGNVGVGFPVGIMREVIVDGINGCIVTQDDEDALRSTLLACAQDPESTRKMGRINHEVIRAKRDWRVTVAHYADVYTHLLSS